MAARLNPRHTEMVRNKIKASQLINRLQNHAFGEVELTPAQVQSCKILLDKVISNAPAINEHTGPNGGPMQVQKIERVIVE